MLVLGAPRMTETLTALAEHASSNGSGHIGVNVGISCDAEPIIPPGLRDKPAQPR